MYFLRGERNHRYYDRLLSNEQIFRLNNSTKFYELIISHNYIICHNCIISHNFTFSLNCLLPHICIISFSF